MENFQKLSKFEMKNVLGGVVNPPKCYECCANGNPSSPTCSDKVTVQDGQTASCDYGGTLTSVPC